MSVVNGEIIVNTDVDARLSKHSLKWIAAEFNVSSNVGVVGAYCRPAKTLEIEHYYWSTQNKSRFVEDSAGTSSIVIAPCYAFRRGLLDNFPDDVVADDVYVSFYANSLGYRVVYSRHALAIEIRTPRKYTDFIVHKYRKSNAFLRESLRFIYKLPEMSRLVKVIMATRISQQVILPWAILFWILLFGSLLTLKCYDVAALSVASIFASFIMTRFVFSRVKLPDIKHRYSLRILIRGYLITTLIMLITGISYPFFKQGSCYNKIGRQVE
jgi:cellulose synthase/poly-beta-1,6-N-acetylglucosamine synthase-like glycosyltransferase